MLMPYTGLAQSPLYVNPMIPPLALPLPSAPAPLHGPLVIPLYRSHDGQLWFPPRLPYWLPSPHISGTPDHVLIHLPRGYHTTSAQPHTLRLPAPASTNTSRGGGAGTKADALPEIRERDDVDPFAQSFGRVGTRTRSLSVVKLEEIAARAAAEIEAKAAADKTLPAPPVPSGKPLGHSKLRRPSAKDVFGNEQVSAEPETVPRTPSLSALSLLRPPQRHDQPVFAEWGRKTEDSCLDALERRLVEQVGTRKYPPAPTTTADLSPAPVPAPVPVPDKGKGKAAAEVLESAEEEGDGDAAAGRTQRPSKGAGASSSSECGMHKACSRKSAKSDPKDREKKTKKKREVQDEEAARLKRAAKDRVAEWLERLAPPEPERELVVSDAEAKQDTNSPTLPQEPAPATALAPEPSVTADPAPAPAQGPLAVVESKPNPRSSGFISVATLRRAPITFPAPETAPTTQSNARRVANRPAAPVAPVLSAKAEKEDAPPTAAARVPRALFGLGIAAAATPSSPALSSSIATPVLSSTASLAQPPGARARANVPSPTPPPAIAATAASRGTPSPQPPPPPSQQPSSLLLRVGGHRL
ncbi:hypothetical protein EDB83DRAFT_2522520 [Lactarius deliciosus]|nr:hypothetical protein EDB83DRAFT_2522520 [Lactarius deliciosus]